jgi:hypothetical protein
LCSAFESVTRASFESVTPALASRDLRDRSVFDRRSKSLIEWLPRPVLLGAALAFGLACGSDDHPPAPNGSGGGAGAGAGGVGSGAVPGAAGEGGSAIVAASGAAGTGEPSSGPSCVPRQSCQRLCGAVGDDPSRCGLGNVSQCGCVCEDRFNGPCPDELDALVACIGDAPSIDCSVRGRIFPGCEDQSFALEVCDFRAREQLCAGSYPECTAYCRGSMLAFCPLGPESLSSCLCGCEASLVASCSASFAAFMACTSQAPAFACDGAGRLTASSCASEWQTLSACMAGLVTGGADAGG